MNLSKAWSRLNRWSTSEQRLVEGLLIMVGLAICAAMAVTLFGVARDTCIPDSITVGMGGSTQHCSSTGSHLVAEVKPTNPATVLDLGNGVALTDPRTVTIALSELGFGQRLLATLPELISELVGLLVVVLLLMVARSLSRGPVFTTANYARVLGVSLAIGVGGTLQQGVNGLVTLHLLDRPELREHLISSAQTSLTPALVGIVIGMIAEVFRRGAALRTERDSAVEELGGVV